MSEPTCTEVRDAAPEYALGILPAGERADVARHLISCEECRNEVRDLDAVGADLLGLVPDAEPPLGFDRRVLARVQGPRRRPIRTWVASGVAAAAAAAAVLVAALHGQTPRAHQVLATLVTDGHPIGKVYAEGHPTWLEMTVDDPGMSGPLTCYVVKADGQLIRLGTFDLVQGSGYWGAPLAQAGGGRVTGVRLVSGGQVIATANFTT